MDELIDVFTKEGLPTGKIALKSIIHQEGLYHNTAHVWFYSKQGEILLQQRAASKVIYPLLWDVSVAGHIDAGETIKAGAVREIKEEIGLTITEDDLHKIGVFECFKSYPNGIVDNEFHNTFISELKVPISALRCQADEVEALKLVKLDLFLELLKNSNSNGHFVASNYKYYKFVFKSLLEIIEN